VTAVWRYRETQYARRELAQRRRAEAILERKNAELEHLIYAASHDLRSPLVNIEGFSRRLEKTCDQLLPLLEKTDDPATRQSVAAARSQIPKSLNYIRAGVARMNALISGLLHLSRLGQTPMNPRPLDMNLMVRQLAAAMAYQIQEAGALIEYDALPPCAGDPPLIQRVFSNLIDNALKYRDPARRLIIRVTGKAEDGQKIYCVADTGMGIPTGSQNKIWELFHRLNPSGPEGEGLGLNLVRRILDRHDGRAWVESTPGEGSRFYVSLPDSPAPGGPFDFDNQPPHTHNAHPS
jgi:signal transduction histidine kinase